MPNSLNFFMAFHDGIAPSCHFIIKLMHVYADHRSHQINQLYLLSICRKVYDFSSMSFHSKLPSTISLASMIRFHQSVILFLSLSHIKRMHVLHFLHLHFQYLPHKYSFRNVLIFLFPFI